MTPEERLTKVQLNIAKMASLSTTVSKVLYICNNPASSPNDLNRVISLDPVLTGQVIKLIISAYYSLPNRVTSLARAIIILGVNTVKNLVLATSVLASFKKSQTHGSFSADTYWAHCLCVGTVCKAIARMCQVPALEQEEYFVAGLLHDLGTLPMIACFEDLHQQSVRAADSENIPLFQAERRYFGFEHCQVGRLIAAKWKLDPKMRNAIAHHHDPLSRDSEPSELLLYVSLANQVTNHFQIGGAGDQYGDELLMRSLAERIGINLEAIRSMKPTIIEEIDKAKVFLGK
ncbi:MAG: HDOD domain-containing protein [Desulfobacterales bacterium]|nr:HDOD domain-containing protein [Desulfobacterales bacterium]